MNAKSINRPGQRWCKSLALIFLAVVSLHFTASAKRHSYDLPDGVRATFDFGTNRTTVITLDGQSKSIYRIESSEDLLQWTVLDSKAKLSNSGSFTFNDQRNLPKCFYRIITIQVPVP